MDRDEMDEMKELEKGKAPRDEDEDTSEDEDEDTSEDEYEDEYEESEEEDEDTPRDEDEDYVSSRRQLTRRKSLNERLEDDDALVEALELSGFLKSFARHFSAALEDAVDDLRKSFRRELNERMAELDPVVIAKSVRAEMEDRFEEQEELVKALVSEVDGVARTPVEPKARRGVVLHKGGDALSYQEKQQTLMDAAIAGICSADVVARFDLDPTAISDEMVKSLRHELELRKSGAGTLAR